jgi:hypothetical protein
MPKRPGNEQPSQYAVWYGSMIIEHTGYLPTLAAAKKFVRARYKRTATEPLYVQKCYPEREDTKHPV